MKIVGHCLIKNEEQFIWYAINSVINYLDKLLIWDTGSSDRTIQIIQEMINKNNLSSKISFKKCQYDKFNEGLVRQEMLISEKADWIFVLDGDEIWWEDSISKVIKTIQTSGDAIESIVVPTINLVGDMFHYQDESAGRYNLAGRSGHLNLRALNTSIPGLKSVGSHGLWKWVDSRGVSIQERAKEKIIFVDAPYLHATHLLRSEKDNGVYKRKGKLKVEIGKNFLLDFYYPEAFFRPRPLAVPSIWGTSSWNYKLMAKAITPLKKFRRKHLLKNYRHGY